MTHPDTLLLNLTALDNRIRELGLKRGWVADQIGIDRKTLTRWLTGHTKRIHSDNLQRLATLLACPPAELTLASDAGTFASAADQGLAAQLIEQENLLEILTPSGKWPLLEELVKAVLRPGLPRPLLGQLYNYLAIAAWRQSRLDRAEAYTAQALALGRETGHQAVIARATLNEATVLSLRGHVKESLAAYHYCVEHHRFLDDGAVYASALSNLGMVYWEYGDFAASLEFQDQALAAFGALKKDVNLAIAWIGRGATLVDMGAFAAAAEAVAAALRHCEAGRWRRGFGDAHLVAAKHHVGLGDAAAALARWRLATACFAELGIVEGRPVLVHGMVLRAAGERNAAQAELERAMLLHREWPMGRAEVLREYLELAGAWRDAGLWAERRRELGELYRACGCDAWLAQLPETPPW